MYNFSTTLIINIRIKYKLPGFCFNENSPEKVPLLLSYDNIPKLKDMILLQLSIHHSNMTAPDNV